MNATIHLSLINVFIGGIHLSLPAIKAAIFTMGWISDPCPATTRGTDSGPVRTNPLRSSSKKRLFSLQYGQSQGRLASACHQVPRASGATLSAPGQGTTVRLMFPLADDAEPQLAVQMDLPKVGAALAEGAA